MPDEPREEFYSSDDLLGLARGRGFKASKRLIVDWVSLGLLDQPQRRGLGQGKGSVALWDQTQASLFATLLHLRQRPESPVGHVAGLANVPVFLWLTVWVPGIPLRQARRALQTWCGRHRSRKTAHLGAARTIALEITKQLDNPHATKRDRDALRKELERTIREQIFDIGEMRRLVQRVFDPHGVGRTLGPPAAPFNVEATVFLLHGHATGYLELDSFNDDEFEFARLIYRQTHREYAQDFPILAHGRMGSPLTFEEPTIENMLNGASRELLLLLGLGRLSPTRHLELVAEAARAETQLETAP